MSHNDITGDRIATRSATDKFREGWDGIFKPARVCKCSMAISILGDGCDVCNPEMATRVAVDNLEDEGSEDGHI